MSEVFRVRRHRILILEKSGAVVCSAWAEIRGTTVTIRFQPRLLPGMVINIGREVLEIVGVRDVLTKKSRLVELLVKEIPGRGGHAPGAMMVNS